VLVVEHRVRDARFGQEGRQVRLPHAFGQPGAEGPLTEDRVHTIGERADLPDAVAPRDADQDRLVVAAREELDLPAPNEVGEIADHVGTVRLEPIQERAGEVEAGLHFGMAIEGGHERRIGALGHLGED